MKTVEEAIEALRNRSEKFPEEAFQIVSNHWEESIPYLYEGVEKAISEGKALDGEYQLHFYALFLLGEFQDKNSFEKIVEMAALPSEIVDYLIGDTITAGLSDILYNTYNGNLELLKAAIWNEKVDDFVKSAMLKVMGQLYLDGILAQKDLQGFLMEAVHSEIYLGDYTYASIASTICQCHMVDMLPEIRQLYEKELIEEMSIGRYDSCVDSMFQYRDGRDNFCKRPMDAAQYLKGWAMFQDDRKGEPQKGDFLDNFLDKMIEESKKGQNKIEKKAKIGRNDPCPCGSGKKYKHCCINKPNGALVVDGQIESEREQKKWLKNYPETEMERQEGRVYLEDYYDKESIEIDKLLYLAIKRRPHPIWERVKQDEEEERMRWYLWKAFLRFREKADKEKISTFEEYDKKYAIHYLCREWTEVLFQLLEKSEDFDRCDEVKSIWDKMGC